MVILSVELSRAERGSPATMRQRDLWNGSVGTGRNSCLNRGSPAKTVVISMCWTTGRISHHMSGGDLPSSFHRAEPRRASAYALCRFTSARRNSGDFREHGAEALARVRLCILRACPLTRSTPSRRTTPPNGAVVRDFRLLGRLGQSWLEPSAVSLAHDLLRRYTKVGCRGAWERRLSPLAEAART